MAPPVCQPSRGGDWSVYFPTSCKQTTWDLMSDMKSQQSSRLVKVKEDWICSRWFSKGFQTSIEKKKIYICTYTYITCRFTEIWTEGIWTKLLSIVRLIISLKQILIIFQFSILYFGNFLLYICPHTSSFSCVHRRPLAVKYVSSLQRAGAGGAIIFPALSRVPLPFQSRLFGVRRRRDLFLL